MTAEETLAEALRRLHEGAETQHVVALTWQQAEALLAELAQERGKSARFAQRLADGARDGNGAISALIAELDSLRQKVARVEALLAEWMAWDGSRDGPGTSPYVRGALAAALADPEAGEG